MIKDGMSQDKLSTALLIIVTVVGLTLTHFFYSSSKQQIEENERVAALSMIEYLVNQQYDNDIYTDYISVNVPDFINPANSINAYFARVNGEIVTTVLMPIVMKGYGGMIKMAVGIDQHEAITRVYILSHMETPGFGDAIHQDQSDWLRQFEQASIKAIEVKDWASKQDGGDFDRISGATITSRSVIKQLQRLLDYYSQHKTTFTQDDIIQ